jgi:hypothetical protein
MYLAAGLFAILLLGAGGAALAITNGQPDGDAHPYVGLLVVDVGGAPAYRGTGFLISPRVFVTAGHMTDGADGARVWFVSDLTGNPEYPYGGSTSVEGVPYTHPDHCIDCAQGLPGFDTHDVGVVILDEPVNLSEYAELPAAGLVDALAMMTEVEIVGYGLQSLERGGGQPVWTGEKMRRIASARLITAKHRLSDEFVRLTANPAQGKGGATFGDNGGPVLLAGTNTVVANHSFIPNYNAAGITYAQRMDTVSVLEWIMSFPY